LLLNIGFNLRSETVKFSVGTKAFGVTFEQRVNKFVVALKSDFRSFVEIGLVQEMRNEKTDKKGGNYDYGQMKTFNGSG
jgi:hypothetical protein